MALCGLFWSTRRCGKVDPVIAPVAVLLSLGEHPSSGRRVPAPTDAAALALALRLQRPLHALHYGDPLDVGLRTYLGQSLHTLHVIPGPADRDPAPALAQHLCQLRPALVLCGTAGAWDGMLPYRLAAALALPLVRNVRSLQPAGTGWLVERSAEFGHTRLIQSPSALLACVGGAVASPPTMATYAAMRRGQVITLPSTAAGGREPPSATLQPATRRPLPVHAPMHDDFVQRVVELSGTGPAGRREVLRGLDAVAAAERIVQVVRELRLGPFAEESS